MKEPNIIGRRKLWYAISLIIIIPGLISLFTHGLKLGIDFTGGQVLEVEGQIEPSQISDAAAQLKLEDVSVVSSGGVYALRYRDPGTSAEQQLNHTKLTTELAQLGGKEVSYESVGPSISKGITTNALIALGLVSLAIVLYIAFAFRNMPPPVSSWAFGGAAIVALLHDTLLLLGIFSILGWLLGVEIDALFVTAILTVIGFSVHDTIVVFDRIRENLRRQRGDFETIVNTSTQETLARSLNTSVTVMLTLLALFLFGGHSIQMFVLALLIGIASGTYSSIFNASAMLVTWRNFQQKRAAKK